MMKRGKTGAGEQAPQRPIRRSVGREELDPFFASVARSHPDRSSIVMLCIGTDRSTGDAFGPLVGTYLAEQGWPHVIGTLREPCDAVRLAAAVAGLPRDKTVIVFDACVGRPESVGGFLVGPGPLQPAEAVGKQAPPVGDYGAAAVVAKKGLKPYWNLQSASLHMVMGMARDAAEAACRAWPAIVSID
ncbi:spore protease YyaC [Paenibacillus darwinianus]|uniref:spore protease YyaC n=1 Tax=Paenibacillus darwinianus TaxID=1380763 RepID=UPI000AF774E5|nr:spore protease YyaC [Paenibacillus darwinianus]